MVGLPSQPGGYQTLWQCCDQRKEESKQWLVISVSNRRQNKRLELWFWLLGLLGTCDLIRFLTCHWSSSCQDGWLHPTRVLITDTKLLQNSLQSYSISHFFSPGPEAQFWKLGIKKLSPEGAKDLRRLVQLRKTKSNFYIVNIADPGWQIFWDDSWFQLIMGLKEQNSTALIVLQSYPLMKVSLDNSFTLYKLFYRNLTPRQNSLAAVISWQWPHIE